jgi:hypothetical protein
MQSGVYYRRAVECSMMACLVLNLYNIKTQVVFDPANYVIEVLMAFKKENPLTMI